MSYLRLPRSRLTLCSRDEILALCAEEPESIPDAVDSPELPLPPVSRFVDEDPIKIDSPSPMPEKKKMFIPSDDASTLSPERLLPRKLNYDNASIEPEKKEPTKSPREPEAQISQHIAKTGAKRKFAIGDENEKDQITTNTSTTPLTVRDIKARKSIKELASNKRDLKDKPTPNLSAPTVRKPLGIKSSNEDISSPKKALKAPGADSVKKAKSLNEVLQKERRKDAQKSTSHVTIPQSPKPTPITSIKSSPMRRTSIPSVQDILVADTPEKPALPAQTHDTPPPADISTQGATSRPSRRARPQVSYAEPNLRDKMRRPSKQLLDAVSGEGRHFQRQSASEDLNVSLCSASTPVLGVDRLKSREKLLAIASGGRDTTPKQTISSPLASKIPTPEALPSSVITERRKRPSSAELAEIMGRYSTSGVTPPTPKSAGVGATNDPYEFTTSSPASASKESLKDKPSAAKLSRSKRSVAEIAEKKVTNPRKRASMVVPKKAPMHDEPETEEDDSYEPSGLSDGGNMTAKDRISRRRSMML